MKNVEPMRKVEPTTLAPVTNVASTILENL
jgi:hypothetical protein